MVQARSLTARIPLTVQQKTGPPLWPGGEGHLQNSMQPGKRWRRKGTCPDSYISPILVSDVTAKIMKSQKTMLDAF